MQQPNYSSRLIEEYEDRKPRYQAQTPGFRPPHLALPRFSTPHSRPGSRGLMVDPNESFMSEVGGGGGGAGNQSYFGSTQGVSSWSEERVQQLQARLARKLGPEYVTQRPGPGGGPKLSYIEGWKVINLANEVFGFNGWSSSIVSLRTDFIDEKEGGRVSVNVTAIIRITLQDGCSHEDVGCGQGENIRGKAAALDKAQKEAVTDATKRALRTFGNVLGNCLYDKEYTKEVVKMKVPPAKFNQDNLERRPEFTPAGAPNQAGPSSRPAIPVQTANIPPRTIVPLGQPQQPPREIPIVAPGTPLRSINDLPGDVFMDESFDAEFIDMGSDSFLDQIDEQSLQVDKAAPGGPSRVASNAQLAQNAQAGPSRLGQINTVPTYQHRHRPEMPSGDMTSRQADPRSTHLQEVAGSGPHAQGNVNPKPNSGSSNQGNTSAPSSYTLPDAPKSGNVGALSNAGTNMKFEPNNASKDAAAARRLAMASAFSNDTNNNASVTSHTAPPIRAESPHIPSGGIDAVAAKAMNKARAEGHNLRLNESGYNEQGENVVYGGFASARGIKRGGNDATGERFSASPTKPSSNGQSLGSNQNHQGLVGGFNRQGPRMALGELNVDGHGPAGSGIRSGNDDSTFKRSRIS
ncbi:hypothetical protein I317_07438 [Kwoniella heveanensis CBS 569]|uniref:DNA repair and recombination protein RAD52 n=1 Tax=Kwoniella heveanensis BCC8398 TaxID=1296120 RepID=A0A1B9GWN4_9TREE|nr:hypothetical protein I316_02861 [Kwoniella heveanensis BCC8398]OCF38782.1 hypothetical protein I317_07438 [Kwoniella heveanensis CBS 569]